jgi:hypothetical protein
MSKNPETKTLSLEFNFSTYQMIHITLISIVVIIILSTRVDSSIGFLGLLLLLIAFILTAFSKKGLVKTNRDLYIGYYLSNTLLFKSKIDLNNKVCFSILKFKKSQKFAFFSAANPDASHSFNTFDIYLLNEKHTEKDMLISLKKEKNSKLATDFLTSFRNFRYEIYSPDFS